MVNLRNIANEWFILAFISGPAAFKSVRAYETTGLLKYIYLAQFLLIIFIIALAKAKIFNIFKLIRAFPKLFVSWLKWFIADWKYWRFHGRRF